MQANVGKTLEDRARSGRIETPVAVDHQLRQPTDCRAHRLHALDADVDRAPRLRALERGGQHAVEGRDLDGAKALRQRRLRRARATSRAAIDGRAIKVGVHRDAVAALLAEDLPRGHAARAPFGVNQRLLDRAFGGASDESTRRCG